MKPFLVIYDEKKEYIYKSKNKANNETKYINDEYDIDSYNTIYFLFINDNHFNYLDLIVDNEEIRRNKIILIVKICENNLKQLES